MMVFGIAYLRALGMKLLPYAIGAVVASGVLTWTYYHIKGIGYAQCKVDWDASIAAERNRVNDATDRANDNRVPDPFDSDK